MDIHEYNALAINIDYHATYFGTGCVIKKRVSYIQYGMVSVILPSGVSRLRHYSRVKAGQQCRDQSYIDDKGRRRPPKRSIEEATAQFSAVSLLIKSIR